MTAPSRTSTPKNIRKPAHRASRRRSALREILASDLVAEQVVDGVVAAVVEAAVVAVRAEEANSGKIRVPHSTDALFASVGWGAVICARPVVL
jgi:hypothetical protein